MEKWRKVKPRPTSLQWQAQEVKQSYQGDSDTDIDFDLGEQNNPDVGGDAQQVQVAGGGAVSRG